jgi:putative pyruvate formate lyase activating enzyme
MPDFKLWDSQLTLRYLKAKDYAEAARQAVREMHRQVGALKFDEDGLAKRGVLVRHLVMPGLYGETHRILQFLADEVATDTYVNVMAQYRPAGKVTSKKYTEINRPLKNSEYQQAVQTAQTFGLRLDQRRLTGWLAL